MKSPILNPRKVAFLSNMTPEHGPTERLWTAAARKLASQGCQVGASVFQRSVDDPGWHDLEMSGCRVHRRRHNHPGFWRRVGQRLLRSRPGLDAFEQAGAFLDDFKPDLVYISQGSHVDAEPFMTLCRERDLRYAVGIHATSPFIWPPDETVELIRRGYLGADHVWADASLGIEMTETMIGTRLPRASTIFNPPQLDYRNEPPAFTDPGAVWNLACIGRMHPASKGQDILLRTLSSPRWRDRDWHLTLVGDGPNMEGIRRLVRLLDLESRVSLPGRNADVREVWGGNHLCVMPSRYEGLPIALVEAMLCARTAVVTRETGAEDIITHGVDGFIADSASVSAYGTALDEAWQVRDQWREMGLRARTRLIGVIPPDLGEHFSSLLVRLMATDR